MNIVIITPVPFPAGMASTQRITLLGQIAAQNHKVRILITRVPPDGMDTYNAVYKGTHDNIEFEYLTRTSKRSKSFIVRRFIEVWGSLNTIITILRLRAQHLVDCIYLYGNQRDLVLFDFALILLCNFIQIPVAREICERTWKDKENPKYLEKLVSPLLGISGVICISEHLRAWAEKEKRNLSLTTHIIQIPILVDETEFDYVDESALFVEDDFVLYSGAPEYVKGIKFVIEAMMYVWATYPKEKLLITGFDPKSKRARWFRQFVADGPSFYQNIKICGFLDRPTLLTTIKKADALLLPLFNDIDSIARFPTKLGEYLLSGKPVVTCNIGELEKYLIDRQNALVCSDLTAQSFAKKIIESKALVDPSKITANAIQLAKTQFAPNRYFDEIDLFFRKLVKG